MRMVVEREIRVENTFYGTVYSVPSCKADRSELGDIMNTINGFRVIYGYVLTKGEEEQLISADFGFEHVGDAVNACKADVLEKLYRVCEQGHVLSLE